MTQTILSSNQIHRLHHTFFVPKGDIKASLLIVHGMSEHSGRYEDFAKFLADNGIMVATYDQLGHGQTVKDKYELGFFDEKHPVQMLCKDVIIMADALKEQARQQGVPNVPHFIMGHSMGSFLVRAVLTHHATSFDGAILMGTANRFGALNRLSLGALTALNAWHPKRKNRRFASLLNRYFLAFTHPTTGSPFAWLSYDTKAVSAFEKDPLCGFVFTNNGFFALQKLLQKATNPSWYAHTAPNFRLLLVSGKDDPVGSCGQDIKTLQDTLIKAGKQTAVCLYPNMHHEPLHETQKDQVYKDILGWLKPR